MSHIVKEGKEKMKEKAMSDFKGNIGMIWNRDLFENLERQNSMAANIDKLMFTSGFNPTANLHLKIQVWSLIGCSCARTKTKTNPKTKVFVRSG